MTSSPEVRIAPPYRPPPIDVMPTLFADAAYVVVDKPSGLLSVPGRGPEKADCALTYAEVGYGPLLVVHRLDMDTSGLLVFARTKAAQTALARAFEARKVLKTYQAVVDGRILDMEGRVDLPIAAYSRQRPLRHIAPDGRPSVTDWHCISRSSDSSRLWLYPKTGRSHQLRLHMQAIGNPILGDAFYGDVGRSGRLLLHAAQMAFPPLPGSHLSEITSSIPF
ncbi:MAG: RluA family pseudouridine synthase [Pseudomonadota bacterium]